jgi:acyl-CoA synthetase (AMP-forming)/AMP-acid ligase II
MNTSMMQQPLLISSLLTHAERHHGDQQIVSRRVEGDIHRTTYRELAVRARRMANALSAFGVQHGTRVATLAWNGHRHMELYYAVSGSGAVLHTLNPRLHPDQVVWIADHAEDQVLFFDLTFLPLIEAIAGRVKTIKAFVAMTDRAHMPTPGKVPGLLCYEDLIAEGSPEFAWPTFDENEPSSLCYTSGTTGNPKGALYSHRSTMLHTYAAALPDALNCSAGRSSTARACTSCSRPKGSPCRPACPRCGRACWPMSRPTTFGSARCAARSSAARRARRR